MNEAKQAPYRSFFWGLAQVCRAAPLLFWGYICLLFAAGMTPGLTLFLISKLSLADSLSSKIIFFIVIGWGGALFVQGVSDVILAAIRLPLQEKLLARLNLMLIERANKFDSLLPFEESELHDLLHALRQGARSFPLTFVYGLAFAIRHGISLASVSLALFCVSPIASVFFLLSAIPLGIGTIIRERQGWDIALFRSNEARTMSWIAQGSLDPSVCKEIRVFHSESFLVEWYKRLSKSILFRSKKKRLRIFCQCVALSALSSIGNILFICWICFSTANQVPGSPLLILPGILLAQQSLPQFVEALGVFASPLRFFGKLRWFLSWKKQKTVSKKNYSELGGIDSIVFDNVSFVFPNGVRALKNLCIQMQGNEKWGLVGENGAGKTTFLKLLLKFYQPTTGRILINGIDLSTIDSVQWRKHFAVLFQDFAKYPLSLEENIALGDRNVLGDLSQSQKDEEKNLWSKLLLSLRPQMGTLLVKEYGGEELSGGEWQKVALIRMMIRKRKCMIFDEPTASLDPDCEHQFVKTLNSVQNSMLILTTHRLSMYPIFDKIAVFRGGSIEECGTHEQLLGIRGEYWRLYTCQVLSFQNAPPMEEVVF